MRSSSAIPAFQEVRLLHDQRIPMRDGITLSLDVYLPTSRGPFPTVLFRTPYETTAQRHIDWGLWLARRGFAAALQDCRGCYESEGDFYAYVDEPADGYDTLTWLAEQTWCTGKIGMWGRSYGALVQWSLAPLAHPNLTALAPHVIPDDYFADYHYVGGAFQLALPLSAMVVWDTNVATGTGPGSGHVFNNKRVLRHLPLIDMDVQALGREVAYWRDWLEHDRDDEYWAKVSTIGKQSKVDIPTLQQCGWYDPYVRSTFRHWDGVNEGTSDPRRHKVMIGPWSHEEPTSSVLGDQDFGPNGYVSMRHEEHRWFDYWLNGNDNGVIDEPALRLFRMGENIWTGSSKWPPEEVVYERFYLHSNGRANTFLGDGTLSLDGPKNEPADRFSYDPENPVPTVGGVHSVANMSAFAEVPMQAGPVDQRSIERRDDVLVYTTSPLESAVQVTGPIQLVLYAATDGRDTDFTAKLVDVHPGGQAFSITEGIVRGRFRANFKEPEMLEPGEVTEFVIQLYPTNHVFQRAHAIRLDVSSSNFPRFARNLNTGESVATGTKIRVANQTILHTDSYPSHLVLPTIPR